MMEDLAAVVAAEIAVLGLLIDCESAADCPSSEIWRLLSPQDFYRPAHQAIADVLQAKHIKAEVISPTSVLSAVLDHSEHRRAVGDNPAGFIHTLLQHRSVGPAGMWHAQRVYDAARMRETSVLLDRSRQQLEQPGVDLVMFLKELEEEAGALGRMSMVGGETQGIRIQDFLAMPDPEIDYVIPGMLARRERVLLTGEEGLGKSSLSRQFCVSAAAGIHPFTQEPWDVKRVLFVDVENDATDTRRFLRRLCTLSAGIGRPVSNDSMMLHQPRSLNLLSDRDMGELLRISGDFRPDLIYIGPLYQVVRGSLNDEQVASEAVQNLDRLAAVSDAALLMEAHAGKGKDHGGSRDMRPRGSSVLLGWPDFGFGLTYAEEEAAEAMRLIDVTPWRGVRKTGRSWPKSLAGGNSWPWREGW